MNVLNDIVRNDGVIVICSLHQVAYASSYADHIIGLSHGSSLMDKPAAAFVDGDSGALYAPQSSQQIAADPSVANCCCASVWIREATVRVAEKCKTANRRGFGSVTDARCPNAIRRDANSRPLDPVVRKKAKGQPIGATGRSPRGAIVASAIRGRLFSALYFLSRLDD
jgi:hypothetical protein